MSAHKDTHILELMSSKICHDLISPIGAVNNGVELLDEMSAEDGEEVVKLIAFSAAQASAKLTAFRMAYGAGGGDASIKAEEVFNIFESLISLDGKVKQDWDPHAPLGPEMPPTGFSKMLISCLLLTLDCMPKGGTVSVTQSESDEIDIRAEGENTGFRGNVLEALSLKINEENLDPKIIHPYVMGLMAKDYGFQIRDKEQKEGVIVLGLLPPAQ